MTSLDFGHLEFQCKKGQPPIQYPLEAGPTSIGSDLTCDIRIKSKHPELGGLSCILDVNTDGVATLENKSTYPIILNKTKVRKFQILKHDDDFEIGGKMFRYVNPKAKTITKIPSAVKKFKRCSVTPNFKVTASRIPVPSRTVSTRKSLSASKGYQQKTSRRSCLTDLPKEKCKPEMTNWRHSNNQLKTTLKKDDLAVYVRRSLFLKQKGDISKTKTDSVNKSHHESPNLNDGNVITAEPSTSKASPRGVKRPRESVSTGKKTKKIKSLKHVKMSFNISDETDLLTDISSIYYDTSCENLELSENIYDDNENEEKQIRKSKSTSFGTFTRSKGRRSLESDLSDLSGVGEFIKTSKFEKSLPLNKSTNASKMLTKTPSSLRKSNHQKNNALDSSKIRNLTPKSLKKSIQKAPRTSEKAQKSPKNDLSDVSGVKRIMKTPKVPKSPENNLLNITGIKNLLKTPKERKSPKNDLSNVSGVKKIMKTPKVPKSPENNLLNVTGVRNLLKTPKVQNSPTNDLTNVSGVKKLLKTPKQPKNDLSDISGVENLFITPTNERCLQNSALSTTRSRRSLQTPTEQKSPAFKTSPKRFTTPGILKAKTPKSEHSRIKKLNSGLEVEKSYFCDENESPNNSNLQTPKKQSLLDFNKSGCSSAKKRLSKVDSVRKTKTPKTPLQKSRRNTSIGEFKEMFDSPKAQKSPNESVSRTRSGKKRFSTQEVSNKITKNSPIGTLDENVELSKHESGLSLDDESYRSSTKKRLSKTPILKTRSNTSINLFATPGTQNSFNECVGGSRSSSKKSFTTTGVLNKVTETPNSQNSSISEIDETVEVSSFIYEENISPNKTDLLTPKEQSVLNFEESYSNSAKKRLSKLGSEQKSSTPKTPILQKSRRNTSIGDVKQIEKSVSNESVSGIGSAKKRFSTPRVLNKTKTPKSENSRISKFDETVEFSSGENESSNHNEIQTPKDQTVPHFEENYSNNSKKRVSKLGAAKTPILQKTRRSTIIGDVKEMFATPEAYTSSNESVSSITRSAKKRFSTPGVVKVTPKSQNSSIIEVNESVDLSKSYISEKNESIDYIDLQTPKEQSVLHIDESYGGSVKKRLSRVDSVRKTETFKTPILQRTRRSASIIDLETIATPDVQNSPDKFVGSTRSAKKSVTKTPNFQNLQVSKLGETNDRSSFIGEENVTPVPTGFQTSNESVSAIRRSARTRKPTEKILSAYIPIQNIHKQPINDLSNVSGVGRIFKTPKVPKSPLNDLSNVAGVVKLFKTPKVQKSPLNDLTNVRGLKKILATPKVQNSPKNDLTDVKGVKKLLKSPKVQQSPMNDLREIRGVKKMFATPKPQRPPKNDLTNVDGVGRIFKTPKVPKSPLNDLTNVRGVKEVFTAFIEPKNDLSLVDGVAELFTETIQTKPKTKKLLKDVNTIEFLTPVSPPTVRRGRRNARATPVEVEAPKKRNARNRKQDPNLKSVKSGGSEESERKVEKEEGKMETPQNEGGVAITEGRTSRSKRSKREEETEEQAEVVEPKQRAGRLQKAKTEQTAAEKPKRGKKKVQEEEEGAVQARSTRNKKKTEENDVQEAKSKRTKTDDVSLPEDSSNVQNLNNSVEFVEPAEPKTRAKRGRKAKEEKPKREARKESAVLEDFIESDEPKPKTRRGRQAEKVEDVQEVRTTRSRKKKEEDESTLEPTVQDKPKPKRGRKAPEVDEVETVEVKPKRMKKNKDKEGTSVQIQGDEPKTRGKRGKKTVEPVEDEPAQKDADVAETRTYNTRRRGRT